MSANLRELPIWLCWKYGEFNSRTSKHEKLPFNPVTGEFAECNDPSTWCTHAEAKAAVAGGKYLGLGIALSEDLGLIIVDFDGCRDPQSGQIEEWALREIRAGESFTEISSSGTGIHILAWGKLPCNFGANSECKSEIYDHLKMFWLTGNVFENYKTIQTRDLSDLHKRIGERTVGPKQVKTNGPRGLIARRPANRETLMNGGWEEDYNGDNSAADLALCNLLARETNSDPEKMDEIFRTSCLYRTKWEREDYRDRTIKLAITSHENWKAKNPDLAPLPPPPPVTAEVLAQIQSVEAAPLPKYPAEVWAGTDYEEFAEICSRDNFIPREFLIESIKTVTGAVAGSALEIDDVEGGVPRFYTVLMGSAGSGKGTSISWATSVFREIWDGTILRSLLWSPATKIEDAKWMRIGACEESFNSAPGMQRSNEKGQTRWLQTFEELDHMIEGSGIDGSGKALMGVNRQLYDREEFTTTTTGKRDAIAGKAKNSLLAGTTPELWTDMFAGKQVRGSGLFQRFNLMASTETRKKGTLKKPKLDVFKSRFAARIVDLETNPVLITVEDVAAQILDEWFNQDRLTEAEGEVSGRLNVLAWRNALHIAWQRGLGTIGSREILDAIKLSDYQFQIRLRYTPAEGESQLALVENKIRNFLKVTKKASRREVVQRLHLNRYGGAVWERALNSLQQSGEVTVYVEDNAKPGPKPTYLVWTAGN